MSNRRTVPDAWDDDYEAVADSTQLPPAPGPSSLPPPKMSRAERRAQHDAANRALWNSAENPETFHFLESKQSQQRDVPLASEFKPQLKVLSRKPPAQASKLGQNSSTLERAMNGMTLSGSGSLDPFSTAAPHADDLDSDEEERIEQARAFAERQARAKQEREEKQRRYDEVRQRLFGPTADSQSQNTSTSSQERPASARSAQASRGHRRGNRRGDHGRQDSRSSSHSNTPRELSPARAPVRRQLFDPSASEPRPEPQRRFYQGSNSGSDPMLQPIRAPRGPDSTRGFARRGG